jgi:hypothetical protein
LDSLRLGQYRGLGDLPLVELDVGLLGALEQLLDALDGGLVELGQQWPHGHTRRSADPAYGTRCWRMLRSSSRS